MTHEVRARLLGTRDRVERRVRSALFGGVPSWQRRPDVPPWFDRPEALELLPARARDDADAAQLASWIRDGYLIADGLVSTADIDQMVATLDGLWDAAAPIPHLELLDLRETLDAPPRNASHRELLGYPPEVRARMREASNWRIHGFHYVNPPARRLFTNAALRALASRLFGRRARSIAAINFMAGSEQALHQDMAVFHIHPRNYLIGAWIACEDIAVESGPLVIYAGSHRAPFFPGFTDYPQTNLRTVDGSLQEQYRAYVESLAARFERHEFVARKGQVLFWHGMLIHGGAPVLRRGATRKSMVIHYTVRGADRGREVRGPFNW